MIYSNIALVCLLTIPAYTTQLYKQRDDHIYEKVLVPVASTVIALDDLPQYTVGLQLGVADKNAAGLKKPDGLVKLITVNSPRGKKNTDEKKPIKKKNYFAVAVEELEN